MSKTISEILKDLGYTITDINFMKHTHKITGLQYKSIATLMKNKEENNNNYINAINSIIENGTFDSVADVDNIIQKLNTCYVPDIPF